MAELVDSSVFITAERRGLGRSELVSAASSERLALASLTASELLIGVYRADTRERRLRREVFVETVLAQFPVLDFDLQAARIHAQLSVELAEAGRIIGPHDLIIAATALAHGYDVLTENVREFQRVPGLIVRTPAW